jgi:prevent-host-death family protein
MEATLTDLRRQARRLLRAANTGQEVVITGHGRPLARLVPCIPVRVFDDPDQARDGTFEPQSNHREREEHEERLSRARADSITRGGSSLRPTSFLRDLCDLCGL